MSALPAAERAVRVAFVGHEPLHGPWALGAPAGGVVPSFVEHRAGAAPGPMLVELAALDPDLIVVFGPETIPPGALAPLRALVLGVVVEPLPRGTRNQHPLLEWNLAQLLQADAGQFDRIVTADPLSAGAAAGRLPMWRSLPMPVDDAWFAEPREPAVPARVTFLGASSDRRERWLIDVKHRYDLMHAAHGVHGERLRDLLARTDVGLHVRAEPFPAFPHRVALHLAQGHLVISEPLSPVHGLEPGIDFLEVESPAALFEAVGAVRAEPDAFRTMRIRGRRKAEQFRASRVWPRIVGDLLRDVEAYGRGRPDRPDGPGDAL